MELEEKPQRRGHTDAGWNYWTSYYEENAKQRESRKSDSVSELLSSLSLCEAELVFLNVPRLSQKQHTQVRTLISNQTSRHIPIINIIIKPNKWRINLFRREDADRVERGLHGVCFRGRVLIVKRCYGRRHTCNEKDDFYDSKLDPITEEKEEESVTDSLEHWSQGGFTRTEALNFQAFATIVMQVCTQLCSIRGVVDALKKSDPDGVVKEALELWPLGLLRFFSQIVPSIANLFSTHVGLGWNPEWEHCVPGEVKNDPLLIKYVIAFLRKFGPQHLSVDAPFRLLSACLPIPYRSSSHSLGLFLQTISTHFILIDDVIYLTSDVTHRQQMIDRIRPTKQRASPMTASATSSSTSSRSVTRRKSSHSMDCSPRS